jgi:hypothetical protein
MWKGTKTWKTFMRCSRIHKKTILLVGVFILACSVPVFCVSPDKLLELARQAEETSVAHYTRLSIWVTPFQTETVIDEIWRDTAGNWCLKRYSNSWDNGLIAVNDGFNLTISAPCMSTALQVPANTSVFMGTPRSLITPALFTEQAKIPFIVQGEDTVLGRSTIVLVWESKEREIRCWIDKTTKLPLREELLDRAKRPVLVSLRQDLPAGEMPTFTSTINVQNITPAQWRYRAIVNWLAENVHYNLPLAASLPAGFEVEWIDLRAEKEDQVVVLLVNSGNQLASIWISAASGPKPASRSFLAQEHTVIARRVADVDITIVASSERQALRILRTMIVTSHIQ